MIELKNGQVANITKEVYNYNLNDVEEGFDSENKYELKKVIKKSDLSGTYGYLDSYKYLNGEYIRGYFIFELVFSNELNAYLSKNSGEIEFIKNTDFDSSEYTLFPDVKYSNCYCYSDFYDVYKDKNGKKYVVDYYNNKYRIFDIKAISDAQAWCYYMFTKNDIIQISDLTPVIQNIVENGHYTYTLKGTSVVYKPGPTKFDGSARLEKSSYTYDGKTKKPAVIVKDNKGNSLKNGTDYTVSYSSGRKKVGEYKVKITFKGNYLGKKELSFEIKPKGTSLKSVKTGKKQFKATWKKQAKQTTGYELQYSTDKKFKNATKKIKMKKNKITSKTVKKLKGKKKYYVRIRTFKNVNGKKICSKWSSFKKVTTKK